ncbi:YagK/YfjJ domain-containing protein [Aeromonas piscicola]
MAMAQPRCSTIMISYLVHFPKKCEYIFDRKEVLLRSSGYMVFLKRVAYFSKVKTKLVGDGKRNFGCSQLR